MAESDSKPYGVVYCIENTVNGKRYVGQTVQPVSKRWASHQTHDCCSALFRAIRKHGAASFEIFVLDSADSKEHLDTLEDFYIRLLSTINRGIGYNLRGGGSFGKHTAESKAKMSEKVLAAYADGSLTEKRRIQMSGIKLTEHQKAALLKANIGKKASDETKAKLAETRKALWSTDVGERMRQSSIEGRKSEAYKAKTAENTRLQWQDPEAKARLKAAQAAGKAAFWADPVKRAARIEKRRATLEAKKAAKT